MVRKLWSVMIVRKNNCDCKCGIIPGSDENDCGILFQRVQSTKGHFREQISESGTLKFVSFVRKGII